MPSRRRSLDRYAAHEAWCLGMGKRWDAKALRCISRPLVQTMTLRELISVVQTLGTNTSPSKPRSLPG
jgi:hypothetical protein